MIKQLPSITGLRAISIVFVLFAHVRTNNFGVYDSPGGQIGVNIFFVISGYLITLLLLAEEKNNGEISLKNFYLRRTLRIFPVYYFLLLIYFILQIIGILHFSKISWITSLTYTKYIGGQDLETNHFWSLAIEEQFYLAWPIVFKFFKRIRVPFSFVVIILVTLVRLFSNIEDMHMLTRADALMWGCVFALYNDKLKQFLENAVRANSFVIIFPFIALLVCLLIKRALNIPGANVNFIKAFLGSFGLFTNLAVGFIILVSINFKTIFSALLNTGLMIYIGRLSYSIYLWQEIFFSPRLKPLSDFPLNLLYILIVANLSYFFVEKPFLRLKTKFVGKRVLASS